MPENKNSNKPDDKSNGKPSETKPSANKGFFDSKKLYRFKKSFNGHLTTETLDGDRAAALCKARNTKPDELFEEVQAPSRADG